MEEVTNDVVASKKQWVNEIKNLIFCNVSIYDVLHSLLSINDVGTLCFLFCLGTMSCKSCWQEPICVVIFY